MPRRLPHRGSNLVINGFGDPAAIETERQGLEATSGAKAIYSGHDLTKVDQIEAMMKLAADTFGGVDILINNAGVQHVAPVEDFPLDKWDLIIALNLNAAFHTTRLAVPYMKGKKWGRIIQTASAHSLVASPFKSRLCNGQAWPGRLHQDGCAGTRDLRCDRQLHLAGLCLDAAGRGPDPRYNESTEHDARAGHQ
jgi:NAD(P)-dependent dehydrogenase (short-subunit alcohol dehydrogenase family)